MLAPISRWSRSRSFYSNKRVSELFSRRSSGSRLADQPLPQKALLRRLTRMKRKSLQGSLCPVARALDVIGDWWSLLIIYEVIAGPKRFGELQRNLGVAKNILATRLKALSAAGVVEAVPASDGSIYQEYVITIKGQALLPTLVALAQWSSEYLFERREVRSVPIDAKGAVR
jgi:DNA-binding HxlR family transcriptional regulator